MRNWFSRLKLSRQLALVSCLFLLIPMLLLCYTVLRGQHSSAIQSRVREAQGRCVQAQAQVQRTAELCNMSTQVYLNTPALTGHLALLKQGEEPGAAELLAFYRTTVASLEKITLSNPDLYQIRVYAEADGISEMMPILYSRARMEGQPWAASEPTSGTWQMDYDDCLFAGSPATPHIMSLVTAVTNPALGRTGTLEVAVRMDEVLPSIPEYFDDRGRGMYPYLTGAGSWLLLTMQTQVFGVRGQCGNLLLEPKLTSEQFDANGRAKLCCTAAGRRLRVRYINAGRLDWGQYQLGAVVCGDRQWMGDSGRLVIPQTELPRGEGLLELTAELVPAGEGDDQNV